MHYDWRDFQALLGGRGGASARFEEACETLLRRMYAGHNVQIRLEGDARVLYDEQRPQGYRALLAHAKEEASVTTHPPRGRCHGAWHGCPSIAEKERGWRCVR